MDDAHDEVLASRMGDGAARVWPSKRVMAYALTYLSTSTRRLNWHKDGPVLKFAAATSAARIRVRVQLPACGRGHFELAWQRLDIPVALAARRDRVSHASPQGLSGFSRGDVLAAQDGEPVSEARPTVELLAALCRVL